MSSIGAILQWFIIGAIILALLRFGREGVAYMNSFGSFFTTSLRTISGG